MPSRLEHVICIEYLNSEVLPWLASLVFFLPKTFKCFRFERTR